MKLEVFSDVYFVISVLVPGFIYSGVVTAFVPLRANRERDTLLLRYLTATAFNYGICSPLIYLLVVGHIFSAHPARQALCWFFILFMAPVLLATMRAKIIQSDGLGWLYRLIGLRAISPIPTGWDWVFSTADPCFVLVTLTDGTEIAGYFGRRSMASSDPERKDIYLETVYKVPKNGRPWVAVPGSLGMHIDGALIAYIEFRK